MPCEKCPNPADCLKWEAMCRFAAEEPPDPARIRWIRERSAMGSAGPARTPVAAQPAVDGRPDVAETIALVRAMNACPYRSAGPGCGCSGGRCALRRGAIVSHRDCMACVAKYGA